MAHLRKTLFVVTCFALPFAINTAAAEEFLDTKPLLKEVVAASPGLELVMPLIVETDTNGDEYPEKITFKFNVYPADSTTKLFNTPVKTFIPPAFPCTNPAWSDWDWELKFLGEGNSHTGMAVTFWVECQELNGPYEENNRGFVYVANTSRSGSAWAKSWGSSLLSADFIDWDDDQQDEVKVVLVTEGNASQKLRVLLLKKSNGKKESDKTYTAVRVVN